MTLRQKILLALFCLSTSAWALALPGLAVNSDLGLHSTGAPSVTSRGFEEILTGGDVEVVVKGTKFESEDAARRMKALEYANIVDLYAPRRSPYPGQLTNLVSCRAAYLPRSFSFKVGSERVVAMVAGAGMRRQFGACARDQIEFWSGYASFYFPPTKMVIETRLLRRAPRPTERDLARLTLEVQTKLRQLFVTRSE